MNKEVSQFLETSIYVMITSLIITILLVIYLSYIAKKTNSMVIKADALHYKTDVFSNVAVLVSLVLVTFTGYELIDVFVGGGIALYIIYSSYELIHDGILVLLDRAVDEELVCKIEEIIKENDKVNAYHLLKTREAGHQTFVEVHLVFDCIITLMDAHRASDWIEDKIEKLDTKRNWIINIHMDPYDDFKMNDTNH